MKAFLKTRMGLLSVLAFTVLMGLVLARIAGRRSARTVEPVATAPAAPAAKAASVAPPVSPGAAAAAAPTWRQVGQDATYLADYYGLDRGARTEQDPHGNSVTRRPNAGTPTDAGKVTEEPASAAPVLRASLRLQGRPGGGGPASARTPIPANSPPLAAAPPAVPPQTAVAPASSKSSAPPRFNPYGRVIKCELVFTLDSTNEQTPLVAVVMEPVYNNGALVIPAGAELHGTVRPDRLRDRLFSGTDWVLVFPREPGRINGRQLHVRGVALDRVEPDVNGMTWGITDGSYGLEGTVVRNLREEEIKRFVATLFASGAATLQERDSGRRGSQAVRNTPRNALLQGLGDNFQRVVDEITAELEKHGVFIRVPAGHQFYFYPTQVIDADRADVSTDIATVQ